MSVQDLITKIHNDYTDLEPILIIAPTERCGTTLLQRAINAGNEAVIYGENFLLMELYPRDIGSSVQQFDEKLVVCDATMQAFLAGKRNIDATALFPDYQLYIEKLLRNYLDLWRYYQEHSHKIELQSWGFKHQPQNIDAFVNMLAFLPRARCILIYRDLLDVAKSFKARWPKRLDSDDKLIKFGKRWAENINKVSKHNKCNLVIKYEDLIADCEIVLPEIERVIAVKINRDEFANKVNSHFGRASNAASAGDAASGSGKYIAPQSITAREIKLLLTYAEQTYDRLGYCRA